MTTRGIAFTVFAALMTIWAYASGLSEIFLVAFSADFAWMLCLLSAVEGVFALRAGLSAGKEDVQRGETVPLTLRFPGRVLLPVVVEAQLELPGGRPSACADMRWGRRHKAHRISLECPHRGEWSLAFHWVNCRDLLGIFRLRMPSGRQSAPVRLRVYPGVWELPGNPPPGGLSECAEQTACAADQGDGVSDTRLYRSGDSLKRIHWIQSIRTRELHTRQYEAAAEHGVVLLADVGGVPGESEEQRLGGADLLCECAASVARFYAKNGRRVLLYAPAADGLASSGLSGDFDGLYRALAELPFASVPDEEALSGLLENLSPLLRRALAVYVFVRSPRPELPDRLAAAVPSSIYTATVWAGAPWEETPRRLAGNLRFIPISDAGQIPARLGVDA